MEAGLRPRTLDVELLVTGTSARGGGGGGSGSGAGVLALKPKAAAALVLESWEIAQASAGIGTGTSPSPSSRAPSSSAGALVTRPARSPQRSGRGKPRAQPGRLPGPIPLLRPSVAKASRHPFLGQALGPAGAWRGRGRVAQASGAGPAWERSEVADGDPWPAVTDTLFTGGVLRTGDAGRFPDWVAAGSPARR